MSSVAVGIWGAAGAPALALTTDQARRLIDQVVAEINGVINSGRSEAQMYASFERLFAKYADMPTIAAFTLGPDARTAKPAEMAAYRDAFAGYMSRKYGKRFREFIGGELRVESARPVRSNFEVRAKAYLRGKAPFDVTFMVSDRGGRNQFYDLIVEGVSLLKSEAVEVRALLDRNRGSIAGLVNDLRRAG